jgi:hypothetical protein
MGEIEAIRAGQAQPPSLHAIARALAARGTPTPRGGAWTASAVRRALARVRGADELRYARGGAFRQGRKAEFDTAHGPALHRYHPADSSPAREA